MLIEMHDADLDPYADLSAYGPDVEWVTEFFPDRGPKVSISERIAADERRENRLRTTHEFGDVKFHRPLWAQNFANGDLIERGVNANKAISKSDNILDAPQAIQRKKSLRVRLSEVRFFPANPSENSTNSALDGRPERVRQDDGGERAGI